MGRILVNENPSTFNLLLVELGDELYVPDSLSQLFSFPITVRAERLQLAESHTWRAANEDQRLL